MSDRSAGVMVSTCPHYFHVTAPARSRAGFNDLIRLPETLTVVWSFLGVGQLILAHVRIRTFTPPRFLLNFRAAWCDGLESSARACLHKRVSAVKNKGNGWPRGQAEV